MGKEIYLEYIVDLILAGRYPDSDGRIINSPASGENTHSSLSPAAKLP